MQQIAVLTSGGDAPGMNAALHALVKLAARKGITTLGVDGGYEGLMRGSLRPLTPRDVDGIAAWGGTVLGSARSMEFMTVAGRAKAAQRLQDVDGLVVIGGNGSLTGARVLHQEHGIPVVGLPASIDNDIGCTSMAIGVDTALNTIVQACDKLSDTARAHRRVFVVEVMGRECGYLAMASSIAAGADACLFRESGQDEGQVVDWLQQILRDGFSEQRGKRRMLILKAEGVQLSTQRLTAQLQDFATGELDGVSVRATVLGHLVRGGAPSYQDRMIAGRLAVGALAALGQGARCEMVGWSPWVEGGQATADPSVRRFGLDRVLEETRALLDGSSPTTQRRVRMMAEVAGVLSM